MAPIQIDRLIKARFTVDDRIKLLESEFKKSIQVQKDQLEKLDSGILQHLIESGTNSARTDFGTAFKDVKESFPVKDKDAFLAWVFENGAEDMLPTSANAKAIREFKESNNGNLPPGVGYSSFTKIKTRRPTKKPT